MSNIVRIRPASDPDVVLSEAGGVYESVLVIGWDKDGRLDARASLNIDSANILWLVEQFKMSLLNGDYEE